MGVDEFLNRGFQLRHARVGAAQLFVRQLEKPALDQTQPARSWFLENE
jgi:hypothetical protein